MKHILRTSLAVAALAMGSLGASAFEQHVAILGDAPDNTPRRSSQLLSVAVVDEDFNRCTTGTPESPVAILEYWQDNKTPIPAEATSRPGWTGTNLYDAGDGTALLMCQNPFFPGTLQTPQMDYSGHVTVSIKLRALHTDYIEGMGSNDGGAVNVMACYLNNAYAIPETDMQLPMFQYNIWASQGWTIMTMTFENYTADNDMVIALQSLCNLQIDYIRVTCDNTFIASPAPAAKPVTSLSNDSFAINWQPTRLAHDYYVHLFTIEGTDEEGNPVFVPATFEDQWNAEYEPPYNYWWRSQDNKTTSCTINGIDPEKEYWYCVQAHNVNVFSDYSKRHYAMHVPAPELLTPTDLDKDALTYTANWAPISKGDSYIVGNYGVYSLKNDTPDFPLLEEDFSGITADFTASTGIDDAEIYMGNDQFFLDQFTSLPGWISAYPTYAQGMVGCYPGGMGQINTPRLWVAGADKVNVSMDVIGSASAESQQIAVGFAGEFYAVDLKPGQNSVEFTLPTNGYQESQITIYTTGQDMFLLDNISVSQDLKAGSEVYVHCDKAILGSDASSYHFETEGMDQYDGIAFRVIAVHNYANPLTQLTETGYSPFGGYKKVDFQPAGVDCNFISTPTAAPVYYDLTGRRVQNPQQGINIKVQDGRASKVTL